VRRNRSELAKVRARLTVNFVGFAPFTADLTVTPGQTSRVEAVQRVASTNEEVVVTARARARRSRGHQSGAYVRPTCPKCGSQDTRASNSGGALASLEGKRGTLRVVNGQRTRDRL
jgi:hypothetical protein